MKNIAIIGAGLSGLTAATLLKNHAKITVFEKSRGVGGRMSTRRAEPYFFDHGAQFFTARTDAFKNFISPIIEAGTIKRWDPRLVEIKDRKLIKSHKWADDDIHYVGAPSMNALAKYLNQDLQLNVGTKIKSMFKQQGKWLLKDEDENTLGEYDWVIVTAPAEQAAELLPTQLPFYPKIKAITMQPCFSLMLGFEYPLPLEFDAALVHGEDIHWICVNNSKPGRADSFCLLVNSTNSWAHAHINDHVDEIIHYLCQQTSNIIGHDVSKAQHKALHTWRYANIEGQTDYDYFIDTHENIGVCGDWLIKSQVEAAFMSARALSNKIIVQLDARKRHA